MLTFGNLELHASPYVPPGEFYVLGGREVYMHTATLERLKRLLWAVNRTNEVLTVAQLRALAASLRGEPSC